MIDYIRDGQEIYRNSFRSSARKPTRADPADLEKLAVRVIHACGMVEAIDGLQFSEGAGKAGREALPTARRSCAMRTWWPKASPGRACRRTTK
jgi:precorrin-8X/cobalt-precorrin-8 methylmutase